MGKVVEDAVARAELAAGLEEFVWGGARRMLTAALGAEVDASRAAHGREWDEAGRRLVVRTGHVRPRRVRTAAGSVQVCAPRVSDRGVDEGSGQLRRFGSGLLPPWCRRSPPVTEVGPLRYRPGLNAKDVVPAGAELVGSTAGLSASMVTRLTTSWQAEQRRFAEQDLAGADDVYRWADGVPVTVRLDEDRVCVLVGVRVDGTKELVALADGPRESTASWADLLPDCRRRGMRAPVGAVGDGALGLGAARREVVPATRAQRDWVPKGAGGLDALPKSAQRAARRALAEIRAAADREHAERAIGAFAKRCGATYPKAVATVVDDAEQLPAFYDFPTEHWGHLTTSNPTWVHLRHRPAAHPGDHEAG